MTFEEKFGQISKKLIKADTAKFAENFAIQITMNDEDCGGTFFAAYLDGAYRVEPYNYFDNTASVNVLSETLEKLIDKKLEVAEALGQGILFVDGNLNHVAQLFDGFEKKKPAAKKTTAKKTPVKKAAKKETKPEPVAKKADAVKAEPKPKAEKESAKKETKTAKPAKTAEKKK